MPLAPVYPLLATLTEGRDAFIDYLSVQRGLSAHTVRAYQRDLADFCQWFGESGPVADRTGRTSQWPAQYMAYLGGQSLARASQARKASSLRSFLKFLMKEGYLGDGEATLKFHRPRQTQRLPNFLTEDELHQLRATLNRLPLTPLRLRNQAIVDLLFSSGIRVGELEQMRFADVDWEAGELRVWGKGNRERLALMSPQALDALMAWRGVWGDVVKPDSKGGVPRPEGQAFLWLNHLGKRLNQRSVHRMLVELGETAELSRPLHPHLFRHSFATHLLNKGVELRLVQELLGHVSIRSTQLYTHVTTDRLRQAYLAAHPRAQVSTR